jgi:hypothetical protein
MKGFLQSLLALFAGTTGQLLGALGLFFIAWGTIAPISTLSWWLQDGNGLSQEAPDLQGREDGDAIARCYVVFLTGVGDVAAEELASGEAVFLDKMEEALPHCVFVREVFPYSAASSNIGGQPVFNWLWKVSQETDGDLDLAKIVLQMRNLWRVALSVDARYGRIYNRGTASAIVEQMDESHPVPVQEDQTFQILLIGTSGGVQVGLGASPYIKQWLPQAELTILSMGGVFDGQEGFDAVQQVYHLRGEKDWVDNVGGVMFPSRWLWTRSSPYNRARREGRYEAVNSGPHEHDGDRGYFGEDAHTDGESYLELTLETVKQLSIWEQLLELQDA